MNKITICSLLILAIINSVMAEQCVPDQVESENACAGSVSCVDVKTKQYCDSGGKSHKKYFVDQAVETVSIFDNSAEAVLILGSNTWKFNLTFFDESGADVTQQLLSTGNLLDQCDNRTCRWELHGGGLTVDGQSKTYKYTVSKHKKGNHKVEPLDPSVIIKPTK